MPSSAIDEMEAEMTCVRSRCEVLRKRLDQASGGLFVMVVPLLCLAGCSDNIRIPTVAEVAAFEAADPLVPPVDMERINRAKLQTGPYRVVPGDVLEFTMPALLHAVTKAEIQAAQVSNGDDYPFICRVSNKGTITLPAVGDLDVAGKSLAEIEAVMAEAYADYAVHRPSIYARILEYRTSKVYIAGVVEEPGVYTLRADQMTLVSLLTEAGGIAAAGAALVRVIGSEVEENEVHGVAASVRRNVTRVPKDAAPVTTPAPSSPAIRTTIRSSAWGPSIHMATSLGRAKNLPTAEPVAGGAHGREDALPYQAGSVVATGPSVSERMPRTEEDAKHGTIVLPVVGMNIPFKDVSLVEGDTVVVEPVQMPLISVLGLVRNPGNFEYPLHARYNLAQAIALAGGLQTDVDPRYATVYRLKPDGTILRLSFKLLEHDQYTERLNIAVRPGDLVAVEHTPRTRTNAFVNRVVRLSVGTWVDLGDLWDDN